MDAYHTPAAVLDDSHLTLAQKRAVLENWLRKVTDAGDAARGDEEIAREITIALGAVDQLSAVDTSRES